MKTTVTNEKLYNLWTDLVVLIDKHLVNTPGHVKEYFTASLEKQFEALDPLFDEDQGGL